MEKMSKTRARKIARTLLERVERLKDDGKGMRSRDRRLRLTALLVAFDEGGGDDVPGKVCNDASRAWEPGWLWARVERYLREDESSSKTHERASSSGDAAGALDEDDESEGILVRRAEGRDWEKPTPLEVQEILQHDAEVRAEAAQQEREDTKAFQRYQAGKLQDWEDWALTSEMNSQPEPSRKRVRVVMVMGASNGNTVAEGVMEGIMAADAHPMVTMTMSQEMLGAAVDQMVTGPPTPDTIPAQDHTTKEQGSRAEDMVDLDRFMMTEHGNRWYMNWMSGQIDDSMVLARWGKEILELFAVTKTIQEDSQALATQKPRELQGNQEKGQQQGLQGEDNTTSAGRDGAAETEKG